MQSKHLYQFGPFCLDPVKRRLLRDGEVVKLTPKAFETLLTLVQQRGKTIEKDELLKTVWAGTVVEENNLNQSITLLRKTLGDSRQESQYIATIPGVGYRFVADVKEVQEEEPAGVEPAPSAEAAPIKTDRRPMFRYALLLLVPLLLAVVGCAVLTRKNSPPPSPAVSSIMVLPLDNLSGDPNEEYFADGVTDALIGDLDQAITASQKAVDVSQRAPAALGMLGMVYALAGQKDEANKILNELLDLNKRRYVTPAALANLYIGLDNKDQAFFWLEKAFQERSNYLAYLKVFPILDPLRSDPRFADLVRRVGLP